MRWQREEKAGVSEQSTQRRNNNFSNRTCRSHPIMTPEEKARQQIDLLFQQSVWIVQDRSQINLDSAPGVAIREVLRIGEADHLSFAGCRTTARLTNAHQEI
jgi:hypothetical protein